MNVLGLISQLIGIETLRLTCWSHKIPLIIPYKEKAVNINKIHHPRNHNKLIPWSKIGYTVTYDSITQEITIY